MKWKKLVSESEKGELIIPTGLKGETAREILDSIIGQMSDGMWENSPAMEHYWRFINVEKIGSELAFVVNRENGEWGAGSRPGNNHFTENYFMTKLGGKEDAIKQFMAKKLKAIAKEEIKDEHNPIGWDRNNEMESGYLAGTISDVYFVYETLLGRSGYQRKYPRFVADELQA